MTKSNSTPKPPNSQSTPDSDQTPQDADANTSPPERDGFFRRVRRELQPKPIHPSEAEEVVVMEDLPAAKVEPDEKN